ncbi:MAG: SDR family NAD(P)-dependent oxidoreductase, partial [Anaerolineae bacterium]|nr:SDR family NAD(P)-dependent oxidoreductase [Anaerolineae bacterium]
MSGKTLFDKIAIVTGGSSGIGRATALALAREGAHVALGARNEGPLQEVAQAVRALGREALVVPTDVAQQE